MNNCVLIPIYHTKPTRNEIFSINRTVERLDGNRIFLIAPDKLDITWYREHFPDMEVRKYKKWKNTIQSYSDLLLSVSFYQDYAEFDYMLICQTDALVLGNSDDLIRFCDLGYDYYGAPWESYREKGGREIPRFLLKKWQKIEVIHKLARVRKCMVGNGGFSLRKIEHFISLLQEHPIAKRLWKDNEDLFFSYYDSTLSKGNEASLKVAPYEVAMEFAAEERIRDSIVSGKIPFGVHAWEKDYPELLEQLKDVDWNRG